MISFYYIWACRDRYFQYILFYNNQLKCNPIIKSAYFCILNMLSYLNLCGSYGQITFLTISATKPVWHYVNLIFHNVIKVKFCENTDKQTQNSNTCKFYKQTIYM